MKVIINKGDLGPFYTVEQFNARYKWHRDCEKFGSICIEIPEKLYTDIQRAMKEFDEIQSRISAMVEKENEP